VGLLIIAIKFISARRTIVVFFSPFIKARTAEVPITVLASNWLFLDSNILANEASHSILIVLLAFGSKGVFSKTRVAFFLEQIHAFFEDVGILFRLELFKDFADSELLDEVLA